MGKLLEDGNFRLTFACGKFDLSVGFSREVGKKMADILESGNLSSARIHDKIGVSVTLKKDGSSSKLGGQIEVSSGYRDGHGNFDGTISIEIMTDQGNITIQKILPGQRERLHDLLLRETTIYVELT
jgi:hypothetical protein